MVRQSPVLRIPLNVPTTRVGGTGWNGMGRDGTAQITAERTRKCTVNVRYVSRSPAREQARSLSIFLSLPRISKIFI